MEKTMGNLMFIPILAHKVTSIKYHLTDYLKLTEDMLTTAKKMNTCIMHGRLNMQVQSLEITLCQQACTSMVDDIKMVVLSLPTSYELADTCDSDTNDGDDSIQ